MQSGTSNSRSELAHLIKKKRHLFKENRRETEKEKQRCQFPHLQPVAELQRNRRGKIGRRHVKAPLAAASVHV